MKTIKQFQMLPQGEYTVEGATPCRIEEITYKAMEDKVTKAKKDKPDNVSFCLPFLAVPTTGNADVDTFVTSAFTRIQDDMVKAMRTDAGNPNEMQLDEEKLSFPAVLSFALERASAMKLSEASIAQWFTSEGKDAILAHWYAAKNIEPATISDDDAGVASKVAANCGTVLAKLSAPVPDVAGNVAAVMLGRLAVLGEQVSPMTAAIRRKLQQRVDAAADTAKILAALGEECS